MSTQIMRTAIALAIDDIFYCRRRIAGEEFGNIEQTCAASPRRNMLGCLALPHHVNRCYGQPVG